MTEYAGGERRSNPHCLEHSGQMQKLKDLRADVEESKSDIKRVCGKLDAMKTYIITTLVGVVASLAMQIIGKL